MLPATPAFAGPLPLLRSRGALCHSALRPPPPLTHAPRTLQFAPPLQTSRRARAAMAAAAPCRPPLRWDPTVYFVADVGAAAAAGRELPTIAASAVCGGAGVVQFRDKTGGAPAEVEGRAAALRDAVRAASSAAVFIVNDDPALAVRVGADGVHVGQEDVSLAEARAAVGDAGIVGVSCGSVEEAEAAIAGGADYIGVGAVFETKSKPDAGEPLGLGALAGIVRSVAGRVPVVAIGGINMGNCGGCAVAGADGVAVVGSIVKAGDPRREAEAIYHRFECAHFDRETGGRPERRVVLDLEVRATY